MEGSTIRKNPHPDTYGKGAWTSDSTYRCAVCHTVTNRWKQDGSSENEHRTLELKCPCSGYPIHSQLEHLIEERNSVGSKIYEYEAFLDYGVADAGIEGSLESLYDQNDLLEAKIQRARLRVKRVFKRAASCTSGLEVLSADEDTEDFKP